MSLGVIGVVLMIVGVLGLLITLIMMSTRRRTDVVSGRDRYGRQRVTYVEPTDPTDPRY